MRFVKTLTWNYPAISVSLVIVAAAAAVALFALSPPLARAQAIDSPATMEECRDELAAGRAVKCAKNRFSVQTVRPDGTYSIDWSEWAGRQDNVERYTVQRLRFLYRYNFKLAADSSSVDDVSYTAPDVNSCRPIAMEIDMGAVTRWAWSCGGITNVHEDPSGAPTSIELLEGFNGNSTSTSWTGSLAAPGRKHDIPVRALRVPGSHTEAHPDNPQGYGDRLTQQQVDDGTDDLLVSEVEMHLYVITVHFDEGRPRRHYALVDGGSFDDRQ